MHGKAKEQTEIDNEKEMIEISTVQAMGKNKRGDIERKYLKEEFVNYIGIEGKEYTLSESETAPFIVTYLDSGRSYSIDENGNVSEYVDISKYVKMGQYVDYNPIVSDKNGTPVETNRLSYSSPIGTATEHGNGNGIQNFIATADTKWRVLSIENETVELISENVIKTANTNANFILKGAVGYLYVEQELNEVCKIFGYGYGADTSQVTNYAYGGPLDLDKNSNELTGEISGSGARSMTIEDINKKARITEENFIDLNSDYGSTKNPTLDVYYPTVNGNSTIGVKNLKYTHYIYNRSKIEDTGVQDMLFNGNYWLASRSCVTASSRTEFNVRDVVGDNTIAFHLCRGNSLALDEFENSALAVRPVVTLKSNVIDISTNYDSENKWKLK